MDEHAPSDASSAATRLLIVDLAAEPSGGGGKAAMFDRCDEEMEIVEVQHQSLHMWTFGFKLPDYRIKVHINTSGSSTMES